MTSHTTPRAGLFFRFRKRLRAAVAPYPWLYQLLLKLWGAFFGLRFFLRALFSGRLTVRADSGQAQAFLGRQRVLRLTTTLPDCADVDDLRRALSDPAEGGWTFYLEPEAAQRLVPDLPALYGPRMGLKILKDMQAPEAAHYTRHHLNPAPGAGLLRAMTPDPHTLLRVAQHLSAAGLGPRVADLVCLQASGRDLSAYVVEHVPMPADEAAHTRFMSDLKAALAEGPLHPMHGTLAGTQDFEPPDCHGNLRCTADGQPLFVDFQAFVLQDELAALATVVGGGRDAVHFGDRRRFRGGGAYLYQGIPGLEPGKRDVARRWDSLAALLNEAGGGFADRVVMDIGCNAGLMLYGGLAHGARWGIGWDRPEVAAVAGRLLPTLGATRSVVHGGEITAETDFLAGVPERFRAARDGVLLYLSVSDHIGFPDGVADLPWRWLVYEGHADQAVGDQFERLQQVPWLADADLKASAMLVDGDSPPRPVLVLQR